jgi:hypothetical protein
MMTNTNLLLLGGAPTGSGMLFVPTIQWALCHRYFTVNAIPGVGRIGYDGYQIRCR